jgi:hypothetical protein
MICGLITLFGGAAALVGLGQFARAESALEAGHRRVQGSVEIAFALACLPAIRPDAELRNGVRALELVRGIFDVPASPRHAQLVAQALAELDRCEEAAEWQKGGWRLPPPTAPSKTSKLSQRISRITGWMRLTRLLFDDSGWMARLRIQVTRRGIGRVNRLGTRW